MSTIVVHATTHRLSYCGGRHGLGRRGDSGARQCRAAGALADRIGLRTAATIYGLGRQLLAGYAVADSLMGYAIAATCFATSQAASRSIRQALAVSDAAQAARLKIRARMHTLLNVGFGLGTMIGGLVTVAGTEGGFRMAYWVAAGVATLTAVATVAVPRTTITRHGTGSRGLLLACGPPVCQGRWPRSSS
jgi:predicted MFS family arabinose efflux permease